MVFISHIEAQPPVFTPFPPDIRPEIRNALISEGISELYGHQAYAWQVNQSKKNQVIVAGTAGGKSLAYNLPVIQALLNDPSATAIYLFPTKALTQDQLSHLSSLLDKINPVVSDLERIHPAIYDGDTPVHHRRAIREKSRLLLTNPDMLHMAILPRNPQWSDFLGNLKYIIMDEIHSYRGVFGSHVANVIRRLNRICAHYGSHPQYILSSATIGNPREHASALISQPVELVDQDGSGHGPRTFCIYNPPLSNPDLGIRKSSIFETIHLLYPLLSQNVQTIIFGRARRTVELILNYFNQLHPDFKNMVSAYRGGYLPADRRDIERRLREKDIQAVFATNALELGIDIGSMDASILIGYPGSLSSTMQQIGRAGRKNREALSILMATSDPIDQYLALHPDYFLGLTPEKALIDPDHLVILLNHLQCAAYELPFTVSPTYGNLNEDYLKQYFQVIVNQGLTQWQNNQLCWTSPDYPASSISLRSASVDEVVLKVMDGDFVKTIGTVDKLSSYWMIHPEAIYLQDGKTYVVEDLDLEKNTASLIEVQEDYYTEAQKIVDIEVLSRLSEFRFPSHTTGYGELNVHSQVKGYKKIRYFSHEQLGMGTLDMPVVSFPTVGCWFEIGESTVNYLRDQGLWLNDINNYGSEWQSIREIVRKRDQYRCRNCGVKETGKSHHVHHLVPFKRFSSVQEANQITNLVTLCPTCHRIAEVNLHLQSGLSGIAFALRNLAPLFIMCDTADIEVIAESQSTTHGALPTLTVYDAIPGGLGLSRAVFDDYRRILLAVRDLISQCRCNSGCPSCIGPGGENGYGGKNEAMAILDSLLCE